MAHLALAGMAIASGRGGGDGGDGGVVSWVKIAVDTHKGGGMENSIKELQEKCKELWFQRQYIAGPQTLLLGATEELGELARAILLTECADYIPSPRKRSEEWAHDRDPAREVGDIITYLLHLCNALGIEPHFQWMDTISKD